MTVAHPLLDLTRMESLRKVRLQPRGLAEGSFAGPHRSHQRGTSVDFADYRDYVEGDDIRLVDWKVFARSDRYCVRRYEAERNLLSYLVVDTSGSMAYAGEVQRTAAKLDHARVLAAALGYLVVREGDEVGLSLTDAAVHEHLPARGSWAHLQHVLQRLTSARAQGRTDLRTALEEVFRRITRRGVLVILSDFLDLDPDFWRSVDLFRRARFDVMLFHVVHPEELELPDVTAAQFEDSETDVRLSVEPDLVRDLYRRRFARHLEWVEGNAVARGCDWYLTRADGDPYLLLQECFLKRQGRGA